MARWRALVLARGFLRESFGTLQGRLMLIVLVAALPGLVRLLLTGGVLADADPNASERLGALLIAEAGLTVCFAVMVPALLARALILERDREPTWQRPGFLPEFTILLGIGAVLEVGAFLSALFLLFYGPLLLQHAGGWGVVLLHVGTLLGGLAILGVLLAEVSRRYLYRRDAVHRARLLRRRSVPLFVISFLGLTLSPEILHRTAPVVLERTSRWVPEGAFESVALCLVGLGVGALTAYRSLGRLRSGRPNRLLPGLEGPPRGRSRRLTPPPAFRAGWVRLFLAFYTKDVAVPRRHRRWEWVVAQGAMLAAAGAVAHLILEGGSSSGPGGLRATGIGFGGPEIMLMISALLVMPAGLCSLGREGRAFGGLRPWLGLAKLFGLKWAVAVRAGILLVPAFALVVALGMDAPRSTTGEFARLLLVGVAGTLLFSLLGTALGFLLPDFRGRSALLPGASQASQGLYGLLIGAGVAFVSTGRWLRSMEVIDEPGVLAVWGSGGLMLLALGLGTRTLALRKLRVHSP